MDPEQRAAVDAHHLLVYGERPCWDTYDFLACCATDPACAAAGPPGWRPSHSDRRPRAPDPGSTDPHTSSADFHRAVAARALCHPLQLLWMLAAVLRRHDPVLDWAEPLRRARSFVGRQFLPEGRCVAVLPGYGGGGISALGIPAARRMVSASADGTLSCWDGCTRMASVEGQWPTTCFVCVHAGWLDLQAGLLGPWQPG